MPAKEARAATAEVLKAHNIPRERSNDLDYAVSKRGGFKLEDSYAPVDSSSSSSSDAVDDADDVPARRRGRGSKRPRS